MSKKDARIAIMERILNEKGLVRIKEMAEALDVSEMTVRRDIHLLEQAGKIKNVNGLLISPSDSSFSMVSKKYELHSEAQTQNEAKIATGMFAASRISEGDSILFDIGSSVEQVARFAPRDVKFDAFCLTLNTLLCLLDRPKVTAAIGGGYYQPSTQMFLSDEGLKFIRSIRANKVFLSAAGVHEDLGISCVNPYEVAAKKAMLQSARHHILVADSSKFGVVRSSYFCDLSDVHEIITDERLSDKWVNIIESRNIILHRIPLK